MDKEKEIEPYYKACAKDIVDLLFDKGYFVEQVSRDDMNNVEEYIGWLFQTNAHSAKRSVELLKKYTEKKSA